MSQHTCLATTQSHRSRRLGDVILATFHLACDRGALDIARHLLDAVEMEFGVGTTSGLWVDRRASRERLVAAHERLWALRHPEATPPLDGGMVVALGTGCRAPQREEEP